MAECKNAVYITVGYYAAFERKEILLPVKQAQVLYVYCVIPLIRGI